MSGTQPRLPGTLPSPRDARLALSRAKRQLAECRGTLEKMREARKVAAEMLADAEDERATAAADFEDDESPGASRRYLLAVAAYRHRLLGLAGARLALAEARKAVKVAERAREAADEDLLAIDAGRRGDA